MNNNYNTIELFYNRFNYLYNEIVYKDFFNYNAMYRYYKIREIFSVYNELLSYEDVKQYLKTIEEKRPPLEKVIVLDLFSFVRNLLLHFPLFDKWDDVYITQELATWNKVGRIHHFLKKASKIKIDGNGKLKYRIWEENKKVMTYISINFPEEYNKNNKIYLKDIISEKEGIKLCVSFMKNILDKSIKKVNEEEIKIMSQVYFPFFK
ncbi:hypothetical protein [Caminibacter pacificus]